MNIETERKFLVKGPFKHLAVERIPIRQGYLSSDPERTVRIRTWNDRAFITIKGKTSASGMSRYEFETEIAYGDANALFTLCIAYLIEKTRYLVPVGNHVFEVDEFSGENAGLVIAEIELDDEEEDIEKPEWLGEEVTGKKEYYNSSLLTKPYKDFNKPA